MFYSSDELTDRAESYVSRLGYMLVQQLGRGLQGMVFESTNPSAIKVHADRAGYARERDAYGRLAQFEVQKVRGLIVPTMRAFDDGLLLIEMTLVSPPFILDFGGAYLDKPASHATDPEMRARWMMERKDNLGEREGLVNSILADFESLYGIYLTDVHPGNIRFDRREPEGSI